MSDYLIRSLSKEASVRILVAQNTDLVNEVCALQHTAVSATAALAHGLTGGALLGALLKVKQRISIKFEGNGPLGKMIVDSDSYGRLRGYVSNPSADLPLQIDGSPDIPNLVGQAGLLTVVKDVRLKTLPTSTIALPTSEIDTDITAYLNESEQVLSHVQIGSIVAKEASATVVGGILIQAIPPANKEMFQLLVDRLAELPPIEALLHQGKTPEEITALLFEDIKYITLEKRPLSFQCSCSWERSLQALFILGRADIEDLLETDGEAVVDCQFCNKRYLYTEEHLKEILKKL